MSNQGLRNFHRINFAAALLMLAFVCLIASFHFVEPGKTTLIRVSVVLAVIGTPLLTLFCFNRKNEE